MSLSTEEVAKIERIMTNAAKTAGYDFAVIGLPIDRTYRKTQVMTAAKGSFQVQVIVSPYVPPEEDEGRA